MYDLKNLVFLAYGSDSYINLREEAPQNTEVDAEKGTWCFDGKTWKIGECRHCPWGFRWGIIGVYDRTNLAHLNQMIHDARKATETPYYGKD
jgi:hypothetical protein